MKQWPVFTQSKQSFTLNAEAHGGSKTREDAWAWGGARVRGASRPGLVPSAAMELLIDVAGRRRLTTSNPTPFSDRIR